MLSYEVHRLKDAHSEGKERHLDHNGHAKERVGMFLGNRQCVQCGSAVEHCRTHFEDGIELSNLLYSRQIRLAGRSRDENTVGWRVPFETDLDKVNATEFIIKKTIP